LASLGVSLDGRGSGQSDSVGCEPRHCASKDTLSEPNSSSRLQVCIRTTTESLLLTLLLDVKHDAVCSLLLTSLLDVKQDESLLLTSLLDVKHDAVCSLLLTSLLDIKQDESLLLTSLLDVKHDAV
jgi:hypothetical protein